MGIGFFVFFSSNTVESDTIEVVVENSPNITAAVPVRLVIPVIGVDARIERMGLTPDGAMDAPKGREDVGWLGTGPVPGEIGSAVIDGHRGWVGRLPTVFDRLHELRTDDVIYVKDANGTTLQFKVKKIVAYEPQSDASEVFGQSTEARLNLITCDGDWDVSTKSYSKRLVVFAVKE